MVLVGGHRRKKMVVGGARATPMMGSASAVFHGRSSAQHIPFATRPCQLNLRRMHLTRGRGKHTNDSLSVSIQQLQQPKKRSSSSRRRRRRGPPSIADLYAKLCSACLGHFFFFFFPSNGCACRRAVFLVHILLLLILQHIRRSS